MTIHFGAVPAGSVLPIIFGAYGTNGESITLTGLATTDVEIYKGTSVTQRASDAGYALIDTDGIDIDSTTGIHGFSIDTGDNTDSGFYSVGSFFTVVVSAVTINSQTVNFVAATFRIVAAESSAGTPKADVSHWLGTAAQGASGRPQVDLELWLGSAPNALVSGRVDASVGAVANDALTAAALAADAGTEIATAVWASGTRILTAIDEDNTTLDLDATIRSAVGLSSANLDTQLAAIDDLIDTEIGAIITAIGSVDTVVDAIKVTTDKLDDTLEDDAGTFRFTENALEEGPGGGSAPTAGEIADAVWEEAIGDHSGTAGSTAEQLAAAGAAGDPWATALPGAYGSGTAGKIVGDNLNATVSSRASQASVDTIDDFVDTEIAAILAAVDTEVAAIKAKTDQLVFTIGGQVDATTATNSDKTGYRLSSTGVDDIHDEVVEGSTTLRQSVRLLNAASFGKVVGAETTSVTIRDIADSKDRITATVDADGNRTAVTLDAT